MNDNYLSFIKDRQLIPDKAVPIFNHVGTGKAKAKRALKKEFLQKTISDGHH